MPDNTLNVEFCENSREFDINVECPILSVITNCGVDDAVNTIVEMISALFINSWGAGFSHNN